MAVAVYLIAGILKQVRLDSIYSQSKQSCLKSPNERAAAVAVRFGGFAILGDLDFKIVLFSSIWSWHAISSVATTCLVNLQSVNSGQELSVLRKRAESPFGFWTLGDLISHKRSMCHRSIRFLRPHRCWSIPGRTSLFKGCRLLHPKDK